MTTTVGSIEAGEAEPRSWLRRSAARARLKVSAGRHGAAGPADGSRRRAALFRVLLAGPGVVTATLLVVLGMALWLPEGSAGIDQIAIPLVGMPMVWAALFFHACLDRSLRRVALVMLALSAFNGAAIAWHVAASRPPSTVKTAP